MKKILGITAALVIGMSSLFAWTNIITLGVFGSTPTVVNPIASDSDSITFKTGGFNLGYIGYMDSGIAFMAKSACGVGTSKSALFDSVNTSYGPYAFSFSEILGVGYGVVNQENLFVGLFGTVGYIDEMAFTVGKDGNNISGAAAIFNGLSLGIDATAVYSPCRVFSLYASLSVNTCMGYLENASGTADIKAIRDYKEGDDLPDAEGEAGEYPVNPFVKIMPSIGIAWRF